MYHPFSVAETTKTAWTIFKKNFATIIVYSIAASFLLLVLGGVVEFVTAAIGTNPNIAVAIFHKMPHAHHFFGGVGNGIVIVVKRI